MMAGVKLARARARRAEERLAALLAQRPCTFCAEKVAALLKQQRRSEGLALELSGARQTLARLAAEAALARGSSSAGGESQAHNEEGGSRQRRERRAAPLEKKQHTCADAATLTDLHGDCGSLESIEQRAYVGPSHDLFRPARVRAGPSKPLPEQAAPGAALAPPAAPAAAPWPIALGLEAAVDALRGAIEAELPAGVHEWGRAPRPDEPGPAAWVRDPSPPRARRCTRCPPARTR